MFRFRQRTIILDDAPMAWLNYWNKKQYKRMTKEEGDKLWEILCGPLKKTL